jgi:hypothetical protein
VERGYGNVPVPWVLEEGQEAVGCEVDDEVQREGGGEEDLAPELWVSRAKKNMSVARRQ